MDWHLKSSGKLLMEEKPSPSAFYSYFLGFKQVILLIILWGIIKLFLSTDKIMLHDVIFYLIIFPALILTIGFILRLWQFKSISKDVCYRIYSDGIEFVSNEGIDTPNPFFIPFDNILWVGEYPQYADRKELFRRYNVFDALFAFPHYLTFERDSLNTYRDAYMIIFKGKVVKKALAYWPSEMFLDMLNEQLAHQGQIEIQ